MHIQLTDHEMHVLANTLARHNRDLEHEIARTDDRQFRHMLQATFDLLSTVQRQLAGGELQLTTEEARALAAALERSERALNVQIAHTDNREFRHMLNDTLEGLLGTHCKLMGNVGNA